ncbi:hypothetical protein SNOG_06613 [Parastagonospora nodorum SN15]|uniref:Uncharacterized protein n=1 Tax=Phaeosphaeria nodorum (strain SN15 / ATCC MYA-4574 / FGSC 10173) TaxID=321614 RepID=Q0UNQ1_PHANO|nr:hypothetical protein SNOG_06613 [Parastagonospora nodorum SN15]EAT86444.1 hypothetical protein SNOG_06613 [Parastagonospora nodorum SN15]
MTAIILSKIAVMFLIVASPALAIVRHVHGIAINIRCLDSKRHWQSTSKLFSLPTRYTGKFIVPNNFLVSVKQLDVEAIDRCVDALSLILLVLPNVYAAPATVVGSAVGFGDVFGAYTLHALFIRWLEATNFTETIVCIHEIQTAFVRDNAAASKSDMDHDSMCMNWVCISDERCTKGGGNVIGGATLGSLRGQLKAAATEFYLLALHQPCGRVFWSQVVLPLGFGNVGKREFTSEEALPEVGMAVNPGDIGVLSKRSLWIAPNVGSMWGLKPASIELEAWVGFMSRELSRDDVSNGD